MPTIKLNTGEINYELTDESGAHIGAIRFNPADFDIIRRAEKVEEWFNNYTVPESADLDAFFECTDAIKAQFDYLLNRPVSAELFGVCNPLTLLADGTYYFAGVLAVVLDLVKKETGKRIKASEKRVKAAVSEITGESE